MTGVDPLDRALAFMRTGIAATADAARTIETGVVVSTPSLPAVWAVNQLRVTAELTFDALIELAEEQLAGFEYRHIAAEGQRTGLDLEKAFRAAGWRVERDAVMVHAAAPDRSADTSIVEDVGSEELLDLMRRWYEADEPAPREIEQLIAYGRREIRALCDRPLGIRDGDGHLVAMSKLRSDRHTAQMEDVYTAPEARGRGFARALIGRAIELARAGGQDLVFIVADDADWPKLLYGRLGFQCAGHLWQFHRD
jgi:ribosomal protein S18 acetylase RimI-like enzyme